MADGRKGSRWSYSAGHPPHTVRVYERKGSPNLYVAVWDPEAKGGKGAEVKRSLGHADREKAKAYADDLAPKLRKQAGTAPAEPPAATAGRVFRLYKRHRTPDKGEWQQGADKRHAELWSRVLGSGFDLSRLSRREWDPFLRKRRTGAIDARGNPVPEKQRTEVGARTVEKDCVWFRAVCRWAMEYRDESGEPLLDRDPTLGLEIPREKNPSRPVATHDRVDAIRAVADQVNARVEVDGERTRLASTFAEIFEVVVGTGRRISAVCSLRVEDLDPEQTPETPHGAIVWPEDTDKMGKRWRCPISAPVREALESALAKRRARGRVGKGPLFPSPEDLEEPVDYTVASSWLQRAEELAKVEPLDGSLWHAYRRLWASSRKDLPDVDVARAGGWASLDALQQAYQQPDDATMLRVVEHDAELREVR